jgi:hypothetical protein
MDGKTLAIGALVVVAMLLGGLVASSLYQERAAYAQGGVYATYVAAPVIVREWYASYAVIDTESRTLIFYDVDNTTFKLKPTSGKHLGPDFQRKIP